MNKWINKEMTYKYAFKYIRVKVKQSRYRPCVAQRVPGSLRFPDYVTMAQKGGKVVSPTHRPPLPPGNAPGTHFRQRLS